MSNITAVGYEDSCIVLKAEREKWDMMYGICAI